jgi:hypothetical protein
VLRLGRAAQRVLPARPLFPELGALAVGQKGQAAAPSLRTRALPGAPRGVGPARAGGLGGQHRAQRALRPHRSARRTRPRTRRWQIAFDRAQLDVQVRNSSSPGRPRGQVGTAPQATAAGRKGPLAKLAGQRLAHQVGVAAYRQAQRERGGLGRRGALHRRAQRARPAVPGPLSSQLASVRTLGRPQAPARERGLSECRSRCKSGLPAGPSRRSWSRRSSRRRAYQLRRPEDRGGAAKVPPRSRQGLDSGLGAARIPRLPNGLSSGAQFRCRRSRDTKELTAEGEFHFRENPREIT